MALTQTQLADAVAERADLSRADAKRALTALEEVVLDEISNAENCARLFEELAKPGKKPQCDLLDLQIGLTSTSSPAAWFADCS